MSGEIWAVCQQCGRMHDLSLPCKTAIQPNNKQTSGSVTKVNFLQRHDRTAYRVGEKRYRNKRETIGFKGDIGLYNEFKPISKRLFGSTCKAFETFMSSVVAAAKAEVNFSSTAPKIEIQKIVVERNLTHERRNMVSSKAKPARIDVVIQCDFCKRVPVVARFQSVNGKLVKNACGKCAEQLKNHPKWESIQ